MLMLYNRAKRQMRINSYARRDLRRERNERMIGGNQLPTLTFKVVTFFEIEHITLCYKILLRFYCINEFLYVQQALKIEIVQWFSRNYCITLALFNFLIIDHVRNIFFIASVKSN